MVKSLKTFQRPERGIEQDMMSATSTSFDGSSIAYWASTARPSRPLVLVHGWACSSAFWKFQGDFLADHHDVVLIDLAGHGTSTAVKRDWSMMEFARDVLAVLNDIGAEQWIIAGHSMGGAVALELAQLEPERSIAVIGVDSFTYDGFYRRLPEDDIGNIVAPYRASFASTVRTAMSDLFLPDADQQLKGWICDEMANTQEESALASLEQLLRWDVDDMLAAVSVPVECISAAAFLSDASVARLGPRVNIDKMENVGHFLMLEAPPVFNSKLLAAVERCAKR